MALSFGRNTKIAIGQEATYNTYVDPSANGIYLLDASFDLNLEKISSQSMPGKSMLLSSDMVTGIKNWGGKLSGNLPKENFSWLLLNLLGSVITSLISGSYYSHTHKVKEGTPKSLSLLYQHENRQWQLSGGMIKSAKFLLKINQIVKFEMDLVGGSWIDAAVGSAPTFKVPASGDYYWKFSDFGGAGGALVNIQSVGTGWTDVEITIENSLADSLEDSYDLMSIERKRLERAGQPVVKVGCVAKRLWDGEALYTIFKDSTTAQPFVVATAGEGTPGYFFTIFFYNSRIMDYKRTPKGMGLFEETISIETLYNADSDVIVQDTCSTPATQ